MPSFVRVMFSFSLQIWNTFGIRWNKLFRAKTSHQCISAAAAILDFFDNKGQIFDSLVHPLKLVQIKNPFGILQTNPQIPQKWVGLFYFQKNMFSWDTLIDTFQQTGCKSWMICESIFLDQITCSSSLPPQAHQLTSPSPLSKWPLRWSIELLSSHRMEPNGFEALC